MKTIAIIAVIAVAIGFICGKYPDFVKSVVQKAVDLVKSAVSAVKNRFKKTETPAPTPQVTSIIVTPAAPEGDKPTQSMFSPFPPKE